MKNWILFSTSIVGAIIFYMVFYPLTAIITITSTFLLPEKMMGLSIFIPGIIYFAVIFLFLKISMFFRNLKYKKGFPKKIDSSQKDSDVYLDSNNHFYSQNK